MVLKLGSKGKEVKDLQEFLLITADGDFGPGTEKTVMVWQKAQGLTADGIVGPATWDSMGLATTDNSEGCSICEGLQIEKNYMPKGEYKIGPTNKEYAFLHHTAGWHNPIKQINQWANDTRGAVGTEFCLGGPSIKGNKFDHDGRLIQAFPEGGYGWHLGKNGSQHMHTHSVGIEVCNFGQLTDGKTWAGSRVDEGQITTLATAFRGYKQWHKYSDKQLETLKEWIYFIGNRDNIEVRDGLIAEIKAKGVAGFEFNAEAYSGRMKGLLTHTQTRKDKFDMYPCPRLIDMLLSI